MTRAGVYRTRLALRLAVGASAALWLAVLAALLTAPAAERSAVLGASAFAAFFVAFSLVYGRTSITVTGDGIVAATPLRLRAVRFEEIFGVVVQDGLFGRAYAVFTRCGRIRFTSLFAGHRELFELILERAGLGPSPR